MIYLEKYKISVNKDTRLVELPDESTRELTKNEMHAFVAIVGGANSWSRLVLWMSDGVCEDRRDGGLPEMNADAITPRAAKNIKWRLDQKLPGIFPKFIGERKKKS